MNNRLEASALGKLGCYEWGIGLSNYAYFTLYYYTQSAVYFKFKPNGISSDIIEFDVYRTIDWR